MASHETNYVRILEAAMDTANGKEVTIEINVKVGDATANEDPKPGMRVSAPNGHVGVYHSHWHSQSPISTPTLHLTLPITLPLILYSHSLPIEDTTDTAGSKDHEAGMRGHSHLSTTILSFSSSTHAVTHTFH